MKVLAINGSPRGKDSCTDKMLQPLLEGMKKEGADTEVIYLSELIIKPCQGCLACWLKTPGKCIIQDDMQTAFEKFIQADFVVLGTPLYIFSMSGLLKNFMDRLLPIAEPFLIENKNMPGITTHPLRYDKPKKIFLVSPCGFPEFEHFDALVSTIKQFTQTINLEYLGEILRPAAELLRIKSIQMMLIPYYSRLKKAGRQLISQGKIDDELLQALRKDLLPGGAKAFRQRANDHFNQELEKLQQ